MDMSPVQSSSVGILSLPLEILGYTFRLFQHDALYYQGLDLTNIGMKFGETEYEVIRNLRLVCHLFNQIASPLLIPIIRVELDQHSLDRVERILKNPLLAAGVRGIQVRLAYRFGYLASDKVEFTRFIAGNRLAVLNFCLYPSSAQGTPDSLQGSLIPTELEQLLHSNHDSINAFYLASNRCQGENPGPHNPVDDERLVGLYEQMITEAYENYKMKYHETIRIALEGSLVQALAKLVSFSSCPVCISLQEDPVVFDFEFLNLRYLERPHNVADFSRLDGRSIGVDLAVQYRIIWELPIAIHRAGSVMNEFGLMYLITNTNPALLFKNGLSPNRSTLNQLRQACQHLKVFQLYSLVYKDSLETYRDGEAPTDTMSLLDVVDTCFSSPLLEKVWLSGHSRNWEYRDFAHDGQRALGSVLTALNWHHIKSIYISELRLPQKHIEGFCQSLGPETQDLSICDIVLTEGSWVPVLKSIRLLWQRIYGWIRLAHLAGGEINELKRKLIDQKPRLSEPHIQENDVVEELMGLFMTYIMDGNMENPALGRSMIITAETKVWLAN